MLLNLAALGRLPLPEALDQTRLPGQQVTQADLVRAAFQAVAHRAAASPLPGSSWQRSHVRVQLSG